MHIFGCNPWQFPEHLESSGVGAHATRTLELLRIGVFRIDLCRSPGLGLVTTLLQDSRPEGRKAKEITFFNED
jgi:hypothetical protein